MFYFFIFITVVFHIVRTTLETCGLLLLTVLFLLLIILICLFLPVNISKFSICMTGTHFIFLLTLLVKEANILPLSSYTTRRNLWMCFCLCLEHGYSGQSCVSFVAKCKLS